MSNLLKLLTLYAIWGTGSAASSLRQTGKMFLVLGIQLMICFWLWSLNPWLMTFLIPAVWVGYAFLMKSRRVANWEAGEARRREKSRSKNRSKFEDTGPTWAEEQAALRREAVQRPNAIDPRSRLPSCTTPK